MIQLLLLSKFLSVRRSAKAFYKADTRSKERKVNNWDDQNSYVKSTFCTILLVKKERDKTFLNLQKNQIWDNMEVIIYYLQINYD